VTARTDELERLQRLREAGILSEEEFLAEKRRVLAGPSPLPSVTPAADEVEEEAPDAEARRNRNVIFVLFAAAGLAVAIGLGIWLGRDVSGGRTAPEANVAMPQENAATDNMIDAAPPPPSDIRTLPMPDQLARAFASAFGTAGAASLEVGGRTINYKPGRLVWLADRAVLLSPGTAADDCHACTGALAIHYLQPDGEASR
jgi:hypothetical protein